METTPIAQGPVDVNVRAQACENLAAQVTASQDGVIASAITAAIGEGWTLASLTGRLVRKIYPDKVEVVALDGKDMLELHPVRFEHVTEGGSIKIKAVQSYRLLRPNDLGNRRAAFGASVLTDGLAGKTVTTE